MAQRVTDEIKQFFSNEPRYEFEKVAGQGGSGIAICFRDKEAGPDEFSRFIIKTVVLGDNKEIADEKKWLDRLRWAEHIVTPITLDPDPLAGPRQKGELSILFSKPYLIIEYIENGTLDNFLIKRRAAGLGHLPNRVLWDLFLCRKSAKSHVAYRKEWNCALPPGLTLREVVKACIAMAWPPDQMSYPRGPKHKRREALPPSANAPPAGDLIHSDMNLGNLMFGERADGEPLPEEQPSGREHHIVPILKLIDFGNAMEVTAPEALPARKSFDTELGLAKKMEKDAAKLAGIGKSSTDGRGLLRSVATDLNILEIGVVMGRLITNDFTNPRAGVLREIMIELYEEMSETVNYSLDYDIFWLVARCLACDPNLRPRLSHLLDLLEHYTSTKKYPSLPEESDANIRRMMERFIFDANAQDLADLVILVSPDSSPAADVSALSWWSSQHGVSIMSIESRPADPAVVPSGGAPLGSTKNPVVVPSSDAALGSMENPIVLGDAPEGSAENPIELGSMFTSGMSASAPAILEIENIAWC
ncbi:hypothetical protein GGR58DRAFT_527223 [Xylaria digitata]|nr:hypothetical protein GGR58DRAFT_527223 [Xylaria digitata]